MITKELRESAVEINTIFENMSSELLTTIPIKLQLFFKKIASETYIFKYDNSKSLAEQKLSPKTRGLISLIYRDYICNESEKSEFNEIYNKLLDCKDKLKYDATEIFKLDNEETKDIKENVLPIIYEEKNTWLKQVINKIKNLFKKVEN